MPIAKLWAGRLFGTNVGNVFIKLDGPDDALVGTARVADADIGIVVYDIAAVFDGHKIEATGKPQPVPPNVKVGDLKVTGELDGTGNIRGEWETTLGTGGPFVLFPHDNSAQQGPAAVPAVVEPNQSGPGEALNKQEPPQIVQRTQTLPKFTIYRDELHDLIKAMAELYPSSGEPAIRAEIDGVDVNRLASAFWDMALPREVPYIHISLSEGVAFAPRTININLTQTACTFTVSGSSSIWVNGVFDKVDRMLARRRGWWRQVFEKHALNLNGISLLVALTLAPSLDLLSRFVLMGMTIVFVMAFWALHRYATRLRIFLTEDYAQKSFFDMPRLFTTLLGAGVIAGVTWSYSWLSQGGLKAVLTFLGSLAGP